ncbi:MAG: type II toxin-antitoxin system RelB/DinJ family antitoxin [Methanobrevibacter sp.]|jgi:antitoxin component of RelBE/YafQ-DinJ toxin-antitoxin module|nr:type II toxin-antitoxin system RelB/DinJ family antitoxin [Candidatus Methanovirga australis]
MVEKFTLVNFHIDEDLKNKFKSYCESYGMNISEGVRWYIWFRVQEMEGLLPDESLDFEKPDYNVLDRK